MPDELRAPVQVMVDGVPRVVVAITARKYDDASLHVWKVQFSKADLSSPDAADATLVFLVRRAVGIHADFGSLACRDDGGLVAGRLSFGHGFDFLQRAFSELLLDGRLRRSRNSFEVDFLFDRYDCACLIEADVAAFAIERGLRFPRRLSVFSFLWSDQRASRSSSAP